MGIPNLLSVDRLKIAGINIRGLNFSRSPKQLLQFAESLPKFFRPKMELSELNSPYLNGASLPGSKSVYINPSSDLFRSGSPGLRGTIAHEAFHARNPVLGNSEALARLYGGWNQAKGAPFRVNAFNSLNSLNGYLGDFRKYPSRTPLDFAARLMAIPPVKMLRGFLGSKQATRLKLASALRIVWGDGC